LARGQALRDGGVGHGHRVLAGLAHQGAQLLDIGLWVMRNPFAHRGIVGDQAVAPGFGQVQGLGVFGAAQALDVQRLAHGLQRFGAEQAHLLADELHLTAFAFEVGDALGFGQAFDQLVGQGQALHQVTAQGEQGCAEFLQLGAFALEFGAAGAVEAAFELALVLQVQLAAFSNKLTTDEIAFFGFTGHDWGNSFSGAAQGLGGKYHSGHCGPSARHFFETFFVKISVKSSVQQNTPAAAASAQAHDGFSYSRDHFEELVDIALKHAKKLGATNAGAEASEGCGLSVSVRKGELENVERNRDKSLGVTVYVDHRRGNASTSDFSKAAIERTVQAAYDIARFTAEDPTAGLPDEADIETQHRDLDLFHPWAINSEEAAKIALQCEAAAMKTSRRITNSDGAAVSAQQSHFFSAHTHGFRGGYASSRHSISVAPIAKLPGRNAEMQRDAWYTSMRCADEMASPEAVGRYAAERALSRLGARKIATTECPVLFESPVAAGLLGGFVQAVSGGALYRKSSFLLDSLGKKVFPKHIDIEEDPHLLRGKGSSPFDDEGVRSVRRHVVKGGRVEGYFLSSYSARKLGMKTTGNAGGSHNLTLTSRLTQSTDDLDAMLQKLGTGLFVIELMGQGVNYVTGDYSRGASGFWVENGQIAYPVHEITIAGNLKDMFMGIEAVGADTYNMGAKTTGSILVNRMKLAGS